MALSIAFTVLYMIGIPSYLFYLIRKAVGEVDRNLGTERLYDEIKEVKTKQAEGWQQVAKQLEDDAQKKYQEAVNAYQQAASTLYSSYERKYRYYKIIVLLEKLILIMVILPLWRHMTDSMLQNVQSFSPPLDAFFSSH
jgi:tryptophan 2,3-dioxygenase